MDYKQIQELIKMVNKSNIGELTVEQKDFKLTIKQKEEKQTQIISAPIHPSAIYPQAPSHIPSHTSPVKQTVSEGDAEPVVSNTVTIKSPMIGTFYRRSSPDKPNFVDIGTEINPGKVVCIIEAMKLFNEIESEIKGKIIKVLADDASPVEYDQPLFLVEPS